MHQRSLRVPALAAALVWLTAAAPSAEAQPGFFQRIATYPVFLNHCDGEPSSCVDEETVAEIVTASADGMTLVYTDSEQDQIGFVDISDPESPVGDGVVDVGGEPTSVVVAKGYAIVGVNTSEDFVNASGEIVVVSMASRTIARRIPVAGQPDSLAASRTGRFIAVVLENERNEDLCVGGTRSGSEVDEDECEDGGGRLGDLPQLPAGELVILDAIGPVSNWKARTVALTGLASIGGSDPEPEYVDINNQNIAVVTLQENNHIVLVRLSNGKVIGDFPAGTVDLDQIDVDEEDLITPTEAVSDLLREPDAVTWISPFEFATANEGDLDGGSRGFSIFNTRGQIRYDSGNTLEHLTMRLGHYPEDRSGNKGNEPEGAEYGLFGNRRLLFIGSERASVVAVYQIPPIGAPELVQVLPAGVGPEGLLAIPSRGLFVVASEVDDRADKIRSSIGVYRLEQDDPTYPTVVSTNRSGGAPIPWGALSALAADPADPTKAYTAYDSFYKESRIFELNVGDTPAVIERDIVLRDRFSGMTFDLDPEGLAMRASGGFWLASEGSGSVDDENRPVTSTNRLFRVSFDGFVDEIVELPAEVNALQRRFGFEGVASVGAGDSEYVYVAIQREWVDDPGGMVRIGRYHPASGEWTFYYYPLDPRESPNGGWVGLSEIVALGGGEFGILERDNQGGPDAAVKRIYHVNLESVTPEPQGGTFPVLTKTLVRDILPDLEAPSGLPIEKVEGMAELANGDVIIVTDNDGVDDSSGETQLIHLGGIF